MSVLLQHLTFLSPGEILQWVTINAAKALKLDIEKGNFEKGKKPGVVLIQNDFAGSERLL